MSLPTDPGPRPAATLWPDPARGAACAAWLQGLSGAHGLLPGTLRIASADASFRRYLRVDTVDGGSRIVMDAPPAHENSEPFVRIARLFAEEAGLRVPQVLAWDEAQGFLLLEDFGQRVLIAELDREQPAANTARFVEAAEVLVQLQRASRPGVLPDYDEALLRRELQLFPDWYLGRHKGAVLTDAQQQTLATTFDAIVAHNLAQPRVWVHRDFMPRNLMVHVAPTLPAARGSLPPEGTLAALGRPGGGSAGSTETGVLGVLDFQDAVYGPISYDIASLLRDAFVSWDEDFVIDVAVRYWERARRAGLPVPDDFGAFFRDIEWMGLQRHLKVAGIFARLTLRDGKPAYLADAPRFIGYIRATASRYRELAPLARLVDTVEGTVAATGWAFGRM